MFDPLARHMQSSGYKLTPPRMAVLQVLEQSHEHLSHAEILARGQALYPALGRATVYRTLEVLTHLGIVRPIYLGDQSVCFCRADGAHHHLIRKGLRGGCAYGAPAAARGRSLTPSPWRCTGRCRT